MALLMVSPGEYINPQAITNNIKYITRTRVNEKRRGELLSYGARGVSNIPQLAIEEFKRVQQNFRDSKYVGKRIFHETLHLNENDLTLLKYDPKHIYAYAYRCAYYYYCLGFQVMFAVHWNQEKKFHIHFVGNAVSFVNGLKWEAAYKETREEHHKYYLWWYHKTYIEPLNYVIQPISFDYRFNQSTNFATSIEKNYYVVARGEKCGIYEDYYDCLSQTKNYLNALWRVCSSLESAYHYLIHNLEFRNYYEIRIRGFRRWFQEYHSFLNFLNILKDRYYLIPLDD